jgi:hypothetical protein
MARQAGPLFITGTIDDLVFYKLGDNYYVRQKGERTPGVKKRLKHDKGYALLQLKQAEFGRASKLVKSMYYTLPLEVRKQGLFGTLTGKAVRWLRAGKTEAEIKALLQQLFAQADQPVEAPEHTTPVETALPEKPIQQPVQTPQQQPKKKSPARKRGVVHRKKAVLPVQQLTLQGVLYNSFMDRRELLNHFHLLPSELGGNGHAAVSPLSLN